MPDHMRKMLFVAVFALSLVPLTVSVGCKKKDHSPDSQNVNSFSDFNVQMDLFINCFSCHNNDLPKFPSPALIFDILDIQKILFIYLLSRIPRITCVAGLIFLFVQFNSLFSQNLTSKIYPFSNDKSLIVWKNDEAPDGFAAQFVLKDGSLEGTMFSIVA